MLIDTIKADSLAARKASMDKTLADAVITRHVSGSLSTLYADLYKKAKDARPEAPVPTDEEVIAVTKKFILNIDETISTINRLHPTGDSRLPLLEAEKTALLKYVPTQLSEDEIRKIATDFIGDQDKTAKSMLSSIMAHLKARFQGQYDGGLASKVVREVLAS